MTERSRIWTGNTGLGTLGDAGPYSAANWRDIEKYNGAYDAGGGVLIGSGTTPDEGLVVQPQSPLATGITVTPGRANVQGGYYESDANVNLTIAANASGNPRIDSIILRMDITNQTIRLAVLQGTPAATPVPPTLTRTAATYEISIADIDVANAFVTITAVNIWGARLFHNVSDANFHYNVQNKSGGVLRTGDIVYWVTGGTDNRAVFTATNTLALPPAGVWVGYTAANGYGRVQYNGLGYIRVTGIVNQFDIIRQSSSAKIGIISGSSLAAASRMIGRSQQAPFVNYGASSGLVLAQIQCFVSDLNVATNKILISAGNLTTTSATFVDVTGAVLTNVTGGAHNVLVSFSCVVRHSVPSRIDFDLGINGVDWGVTDLGAADGIARGQPVAVGAQGYLVSWTGLLFQTTVPVNPSGWLWGAANTIQLRWKTGAATATILNSNTGGEDYPIMISATGLG